MYKIWFESKIPDYCYPLIEHIAVAFESDRTDTNRFAGVEDAHGIIAGGLNYDAAMMALAPNLLVITRSGIGYDRVNLDDATAHGIAVCNTPDGPTVSTAEHALALMLSVAKNLKSIELKMHRSDRKTPFYAENFGLELYGKQLGLVGLGRIGAHIAKIAKAIGMTVIAYDPYIPAERGTELGVGITDNLADMLASSDVVSVHAPLTPKTYQLMNAERFGQMKPGAIFINTARGGLVDELALIAALESGHIAAAGLDVTDPEPPMPDNPLMAMDNVLITPHIASATTVGKKRIMTMAMEQTLYVLRGERPPHLLNGEVWDRVIERLGHIKAS